MNIETFVNEVKWELRNARNAPNGPHFPIYVGGEVIYGEHFIDAQLDKGGKRQKKNIPIVQVALFRKKLSKDSGEVVQGNTYDLLRRLPSRARPFKTYFTAPHQSDREFKDAKLGQHEFLAHFYTGKRGQDPLTVIVRTYSGRIPKKEDNGKTDASPDYVAQQPK